MADVSKARKLGRGLAGLMGTPVAVPLPPQVDQPVVEDKKLSNTNITEQKPTYVVAPAVAKAVSCDVVLYNVPGRTSIDLSADTLLRIVEAAPNVTATKEATNNVLRAQELVRRSDGKLTVLSGDDALTLPMVAVGAKGVISVTSNLLPGHVSRATRLALEGKWEEARAAHFALLPVHEIMFVEANPGPVKAALAAQGLGSENVRGPLAKIAQASRAKVLEVVKAYLEKAGPDPRVS